MSGSFLKSVGSTKRNEGANPVVPWTSSREYPERLLDEAVDQIIPGAKKKEN